MLVFKQLFTFLTVRCSIDEEENYQVLLTNQGHSDPFDFVLMQMRNYQKMCHQGGLTEGKGSVRLTSLY
jgi:hypothetical protein